MNPALNADIPAPSADAPKEPAAVNTNKATSDHAVTEQGASEKSSNEKLSGGRAKLAAMLAGKDAIETKTH